MRRAEIAGADSDNPLERLLASLATPAADQEPARSPARSPASEAGEPAASTASFFYGPDEATELELARRREAAAWAVEGSVGRTVLTSLLFPFALMSASKEQWDRYPEDEAALRELLGGTANATDATAVEP